MKKAILILTVIIISNFSVNAQNNDDLNWISSFKKAKEIAVSENKPILIFFTGSDWCGLCKMLDKDFFASEKFKKIAKKSFVLYKADFPRRTDIVSEIQKKENTILDKKYSKTRGQRVFPTIVIVDANGKEIEFLESYNYIHDTSRHYKLINYILKKYQTK